jgi:hypothetical protein
MTMTMRGRRMSNMLADFASGRPVLSSGRKEGIPLIDNTAEIR